VESGATINFEVRALKAFTMSAWSVNFPCQTKALPPGNFHIVKDSENHFYWDAVLYASMYILKESTDAAQTQNVFDYTLSSATTSCDMALMAGTVRYYSISTWLGSPETNSDPTPTLQDINYCPSPTMNGATALSSSEIQLWWSSVVSAQTYNVYRDVSSTGNFATLAGTTSHPDCIFNDTGLSPLTTYYYKVSAQGFDGLTESPKSNTGSAATPSDVPIPQNVSATTTQMDSVLITWDAVAADHYQVFRCSVSDGTYTSISGNITSPTEYTDSTGTLDAWYYYKVKAFNSSGDPSDFSSYSAGRPVRITAPTTVSGTFGTYSDRIAVTWGSVAGAEKYRLYRADTEYGTYSYLAEITGGVTYDDTDADLYAGFDLWYKVKAVSAGGNESLLSTQKGKGYASYGIPNNLIPATVTATYSAGSVTITWSAVSEYTHYQVVRVYNLVQEAVITADTSSTSATDSNPVLGRTSDYYVMVIDSAGRICAYARSGSVTIP
jgi:fibronectin type 3 domain-containing protein